MGMHEEAGVGVSEVKLEGQRMLQDDNTELF